MVRITVAIGKLTRLATDRKTITATVGTAITPLTFTTTLALATGAYTISPTLPAGLSIDGTTGDITGTPTTAKVATDYTITVKGNGHYTGSATAIVTIWVKTPLTSLKVSESSYIAGKNVAIVSSPTLTRTPAAATGTYSISPNLPSGLSINATTGAIRGTATSTQAATTYTITFTGKKAYAGSVTVDVSVTVLARGKSYGGGKIFYFDGEGGGLIAATSKTGILPWDNAETPSSVSGADGTAIGTGEQNTKDIVAALGSGDNRAAGKASREVIGSYGDWFLPSIDELAEMGRYKFYIGGGLRDKICWSSSESSSGKAWFYSFGSSKRSSYSKRSSLTVWLVREF